MIKYVGKILLCALSLVIGTMIGGTVSTVLRLGQPRPPEPVDMQLMGILCFISGIIISVVLAELSRSLPGKRRARFAAIAWFVFAWLGINNTIEASIFTTMGGGPSVIVTMLFPSLFVAGAVVLLFGGREAGTSFSSNLRRFFVNRTAAQWTIRLSAAVLAFPIIYFLFGMPVGLIVGQFYRDHEFGLQMPSSLSVLIGVQIIRSLVSLLAVLPVLVAWPGSRQRFAWTFGLNLFVLSGLYGLIQAYWMPRTMRSIHAVELLFDSLAYGWLLAVLLLPRPPVSHLAPAGEVGKPNDNAKLVA